MNVTFRKASCVAVFIASLVLSLHLGSTESGLQTLLNFLLGLHQGEDLPVSVFLDLRVTRVLSCVLSGAALASAGVLSQGLFRNALASPSVIGTTSGGAAFATFTLVAGFTQPWAVPIGAFFGCVVATLLVLYIGQRVGSWGIESLLLTGLAISALFSALTSLNLSIALDEFQRLPVLMHWLMGSVRPHSWLESAASGACILAAMAWALHIARKLDVLALGDDVAASLGVDMKSFTISTVLCIALLEALSMSLSGALTFIGLMIPHITRTWIGPHHRSLLIFSALNGASLLCLSDLLARTLAAPVEFQVGIVIACLGSAFFVYLLLTYETKGRE